VTVSKFCKDRQNCDIEILQSTLAQPNPSLQAEQAGCRGPEFKCLWTGGDKRNCR